MTKVACANCEWTGDDSDCDEYRDFWSRVQPGEIIPHGDCPECGAFCYEAKDDDDSKDQTIVDGERISDSQGNSVLTIHHERRDTWSSHAFVSEATAQYERHEWVDVRARRVKWSHLVKNRIEYALDYRSSLNWPHEKCRAEHPATVY